MQTPPPPLPAKKTRTGDSLPLGIHSIAEDIVVERMHPSHPELMSSDTDVILNFLSRSYSSSVHGLSTTLMLSMLKKDFIVENIPADELSRILSFVYFGRQ